MKCEDGSVIGFDGEWGDWGDWHSEPCAAGFTGFKFRLQPPKVREGLNTAIKPLLSHSATREFDSPLQHLRTPKKCPS
eukprot:1193619-Prorocentrum_minimum.AAC.3